jgi:4-carboxymuconolactone decarboxylase
MNEDLKTRTAKTAKLYFEGYPDERPFELWRSFDKGLAKDLSLFITGQMYARQRIPHQTRQLITVAALTVLDRPEELKLHIYAALNVGCSPQEVAEVMFQCGIYGGIPVVNRALKVLREVLQERGQWPMDEIQD